MKRMLMLRVAAHILNRRSFIQSEVKEVQFTWDTVVILEGKFRSPAESDQKILGPDLVTI
jgi:hypothetical protein